MHVHPRHSSNTIMTVWTASKQQTHAQRSTASLDEALLDRFVQRLVTPDAVLEQSDAEPLLASAAMPVKTLDATA